MDDGNLERFVEAQRFDYDQALAEIRAGHKYSHWIWYIFPQLQGLGRSAMCQRYGIHGLDEATRYLAHPLLGGHLVEISRALLDLPTSDPVAVLGGIDAKKVCSSMTLFSLVEGADPVFSQVLDKFYGGRRDGLTLHLLGIN